MSKLRPLKQRKVINILLKNGFKEVRRGKHITFKKYLPNGEVLTTWVPYHSEISVFCPAVYNKANKEIKRGIFIICYTSFSIGFVFIIIFCVVSYLL